MFKIWCSRYDSHLYKRFQQQKMNAEYKLQLTKVVEMEDKFVKGFSKEKWKEYFDLNIEKGQLANQQVDHVIEFDVFFVSSGFWAFF